MNAHASRYKPDELQIVKHIREKVKGGTAKQLPAAGKKHAAAQDTGSTLNQQAFTCAQPDITGEELQRCAVPAAASCRVANT